MRCVIQRVQMASVKVEGEQVGCIASGLLVFIGVGKEDTQTDLSWMVKKIVELRIFEDVDGKMNHSVMEKKGEILLVSQFTLYGDCRKGKRPSFTEAAAPELAEDYYKQAIEQFREQGIKVETGIFGADMQVELVNDGPVTIILER